MSVLENFKNIPWSTYGRATGLKCNFFSSNLQRSPWRKKRGGLSPPQRATGPPLKPLHLSFEPKNSGKMRGVMKHRSINIPSIVCNGKYESDQ